MPFRLIKPPAFSTAPPPLPAPRHINPAISLAMISRALERMETALRYAAAEHSTETPERTVPEHATATKHSITQPLQFSQPQLLTALRNEALKLISEDTAVCRKIGEYGAELLTPGMGVLTHCNAGALAASKYGTALAPIYISRERGVNVRVFADETRPLLQGARLTSYELYKSGVDVTLICDNMASSVMQKGWADIVFVGCDRVAANGDTANKIGTSGVAVLAAEYGIPVYVCAPFSTIDPATPTGADIIIEERDPSEVTDLLLKSAHELNKCVIVVTHSPDVAKMADAVFSLKRGLLYTA